ncbi:MAG: sodium:proton antiporter [Planctomycetales bacterium 4572_13]|nr:MAG: sodium:proton antiporter [Planctomycetales bacterium 4572_13]
MKRFIKQWRFTLILITAVAAGALLGYFLGPKAERLKPLGDLLLNLLFTAVVPLVFFSLSSAVAGSSNLKRLGRITGLMLIIFVVTGIVSALLMVFAVQIFDPAEGLTLELAQPPKAAGDRGKPFREFLVSGAAVMGYSIKLIMWYAPIGLGAYFAYLVGVFGPELIGTYARVVGLYYPLAIGYFVVGFSFYAFIAAGRGGVKRYWANILPPALTAWGTGSSLAALPANMEAAERIGVPEDVCEIVLPLGATIHMDGSCLAAILKIAVLFALFGRPFTGVETLAGAVGVALLCGVVMSGIPGGGFLGEMLIVTLYGFGPEALPIISMLGALVDPPATMINASGDTVAAMMVTRLLERKKRKYQNPVKESVPHPHRSADKQEQP